MPAALNEKTLEEQLKAIGELKTAYQIVFGQGDPARVAAVQAVLNDLRPFCRAAKSTWSEHLSPKTSPLISPAPMLPHASSSTSGTLPAISSYAYTDTRRRTGTSWFGMQNRVALRLLTLACWPRDLPRPSFLVLRP